MENTTQEVSVSPADLERLLRIADYAATWRVPRETRSPSGGKYILDEWRIKDDPILLDLAEHLAWRGLAKVTKEGGNVTIDFTKQKCSKRKKS